MYSIAQEVTSWLFQQPYSGCCTLLHNRKVNVLVDANTNKHLASLVAGQLRARCNHDSAYCTIHFATWVITADQRKRSLIAT